MAAMLATIVVRLSVSGMQYDASIVIDVFLSILLASTTAFLSTPGCVRIRCDAHQVPLAEPQSSSCKLPDSWPPDPSFSSLGFVLLFGSRLLKDDPILFRFLTSFRLFHFSLCDDTFPVRHGHFLLLIQRFFGTE